MSLPDVALRAVTANAASGRDQRGRPAYDAFVAAAARTQSDLDADVWAVQEVDHLLPRSGSSDQTALLGTALAGDGPAWHSRFVAAVRGTPGDAATFGPAGDVGPDGGSGCAPGVAEPSYGVALHSRHPVRAWHALRMGPSGLRIPVPLPADGVGGARWQWVPDEPRVALAAEVAAPGRVLTVVTTHLSFAPWRARDQLRQVLRWSATLPRPVVLLGDLNLRGQVPARLAAAAGFVTTGSAPTYPAHRPRWRLDHALLHPGREVVRLLETATPRLGGSDHLAVCVEVGPPDRR